MAPATSHVVCIYLIALVECLPRPQEVVCSIFTAAGRPLILCSGVLRAQTKFKWTEAYPSLAFGFLHGEEPAL